MEQKKNTLLTGTLWIKMRECQDKALQCGALQPIATDYEIIEQEGINFLVRIVSNLNRKAKATKKQETEKAFNPFLPYDEDLFVCDLSPTHLCLLNKYNVVDDHLLIVTRLFEDQETWLNEQDFQALWITLAEIDGLGFYNGGPEAGASQKHKHLQIVPLPLSPTGEKMPISSLISEFNCQENSIFTLPYFPFVHAIAFLDPQWVNSPLEAGKKTLSIYHKLLKRVGLIKDTITGLKQTAPYNLLVTREWMMIIPRSQDSYQNIAVNSLGFAGALLVKNAEQMQLLKEIKPLSILQNVSQVNHSGDDE